MEDEMEVEVEVFEVVEIDIDYEFEAARFFDFTREETEEEVFEAELWFETATTYPPSPFVAELFSMGKFFPENINVSPKLKCTDDQVHDQQDDTFKGSYRGLTFYDHLSNDVKNLKTKPSIKPYLPRSSTLMKPTASQLAKQSSRIQSGGSRFQKLPASIAVHCGVETQASKRQKLDGGLLRKVVDLKQQNDLVHKVPKKDGIVPAAHGRLKITIPVEPDFATGSRRQRLRLLPTRLVSTNRPIKKDDYTTGRTSTFRARPLNRKILEAPTLPLSKKTMPKLPEFEVFHLKTTERAKQQNNAVRPTLLNQTYKGFEKLGVDPTMDRSKFGSRPKAVDTRSEDICKAAHSFKARPFEKKIFASKGDMGVFRNNKQAVTVPKEFNFQTDKKLQQNPLTELFGKLSIAPEVQPKIPAPSPSPWPSCISSKGSKENRGGTFQQDQNMKHLTKRLTQVQHRSNQ